MVPIYEFRCPGCGDVVSRLSRLDEDGRRLSCASCGYEGLEKLFSVFSSPRTTAVATAAGSAPARCHGCHEADSCRRPG